MELKIAENVLILQFNVVFTMAIASIALLSGVYVRKKSRIIEHTCLPIALIGSVFVILIRLLLYYCFATEVTFDLAMLPYLFLAFFAAIGLNASASLMRRGGKVLLFCMIACWIMSALQNILGIIMSHLFGVHLAFGVLAGAASLIGGHASAIAFGSWIESSGVAGAEAIGIAAATFGVLAGGAIGAPLGKFLITRHNVKIETTRDISYSPYPDDESRKGIIDPTKFLRMLSVVLVCMALGSWIGERFNEFIEYSSIHTLQNFRFPDYVWTMLLAVIMRNAGDAFNIFKRCADSLGLILSLSLRFAVISAGMSLSIRDISGVALPLTVILCIQTFFVVIIVLCTLFPLLGSDYDAAVICSGLLGLMLGAPHSGVSNISTLCEQTKVFSHKAMLVISLCGAALVDIFMMPFSSVCISMLL